MLVQVVVQMLAQEVHHEVAHRDARLNLLRAQLDFGLRLEDRVGHLDRDGGDNRRADVRRVVVLVVELLDGLGDGLAEGGLVRTALRGVLSVDERVVALAVARAVGDGHLVEQAVLRDVAPAVEPDGQPEVQIGVVLHHLLDILHVVGIGAEDLLVDAEGDEGAVLLVGVLLPALALFEPLGEGHLVGPAVAHRAGRELAREHVHRLDAHAVQTHRLLEGRAAVLAAGVHLRDGRRERVERDAAAVVAHGDQLPLDRDVDLASGAHDELVDRVVHHLLDEDVDAVVGLRAVAQLADVHARAQADMLAGREGDDGVVAVVVRRNIIQ